MDTCSIHRQKDTCCSRPVFTFLPPWMMISTDLPKFVHLFVHPPLIPLPPFGQRHAYQSYCPILVLLLHPKSRMHGPFNDFELNRSQTRLNTSRCSITILSMRKSLKKKPVDIHNEVNQSTRQTLLHLYMQQQRNTLII